MEKLLVTSNFSFSHSVFKRLVMQTHKNQGLFGKGLKQLNKVRVEGGYSGFQKISSKQQTCHLQEETVHLLKEEMKKHSTAKAFVIEGFPRDKGQVEAFIKEVGGNSVP